jgi:hypothetical protein
VLGIPGCDQHTLMDAPICCLTGFAAVLSAI